MFALHQDLVRQVLGNARLLIARREDVQAISEAIATASPAANRAIAAWDPQGLGYCPETVAYDIASTAARAISRIRGGTARNGPVTFKFQVEIGDFIFVMKGAQTSRGDDIAVKVVDRRPCVPADPEENAYLASFVRNGGRLVFFGPDGTMVECAGPPPEDEAL